MSDYFSVLTNTGAAIETAAKDSGVPVTFSHIVVGSVDQPGTVAQLKQKTALGQEEARVAVSKVSTHPSYPDQLIIEGVIPPGEGGWYVREAGVISDAKLYSIARYPETYKSDSLGVPTEMYIRLVVKTTGAPNITYVGGSPNPMIPQASVVETVRQTRGTETEAGSLEIANDAETKGGSDKTRAIVPYYLKLWWDSVRTWSNIKNIPAYASRWPSWSEVTGKPSTMPPSGHSHSGSDVSAGSETARGTLEIANDAETKGGSDKTRAIVPYYLKLWWDQVRVWDNIKNKPETATRWPTASEVRRFAGELAIFSTPTLPAGFPGFVLDGSTIPNGVNDFPELAASGSRFITISGNDIILLDVPDVIRGKGSSNREVGEFQGDAILNITGEIGAYGVKDDQGREKGAFERIKIEQMTTNPGTDANKAMNTLSFDASRVVRTAPENRVKSTTALFAIYYGKVAA